MRTHEPSTTERPPERLPAVDDREFSVVRKGYDTEEVKAYLEEVESNFRELERWAGELAAIEEDEALTAGQKQAMTEIYTSFVSGT